MADPWKEPAKPLAPGLVMAPAREKLELEAVEPTAIDPDELKDIEDLRAQNKALQRDNKVLMDQIEEAWAVIKSRDEQIEYLHQAQQ